MGPRDLHHTFHVKPRLDAGAVAPRNSSIRAPAGARRWPCAFSGYRGLAESEHRCRTVGHGRLQSHRCSVSRETHPATRGGGTTTDPATPLNAGGMSSAARPDDHRRQAIPLDPIPAAAWGHIALGSAEPRLTENAGAGLDCCHSRPMCGDSRSGQVCRPLPTRHGTASAW